MMTLFWATSLSRRAPLDQSSYFHYNSRMNFIQNILMRALGLGKAVDALDGETSKAYLGGVGLILTGAATALGGLAGIAGELIAAHGGPAYWALASNIPHDASAGLFLAGLAGIHQGISQIGQRHALADSENSAVSLPAQSIPAVAASIPPATK